MTFSGMQGKTVISVVTPVYNEHLNIEKFYEEVTKYMSDLPYDYEIIFVDDGSTDATPLVRQSVDTVRTCMCVP